MKRVIFVACALVLLAGAVPSEAQNGVALFSSPSTMGPLVTLCTGDCAGGEIYDDGTAENGYSGNPALISSFEGVSQFTPASYPWVYDTVCVALVSLGGATLDFEIEVRDDDGTGGEPGTLLGTLPVLEGVNIDCVARVDIQRQDHFTAQRVFLGDSGTADGINMPGLPVGWRQRLTWGVERLSQPWDA